MLCPKGEILSAGTRAAFEKAGWFPGRRVEIEKYCNRLRRGGKEPFDVVKDFFAEFGGLRLEKRAGAPGELEEWFSCGVAEPCFLLMQFYSEAVGEYLFE